MTSIEERLSPMYFRSLMFLLLSTECEKWGLALKGVVKNEFKMRLENYLGAQRMLNLYCKKMVDQDVTENFSELFSRVIEKLHETDPLLRDDLFNVIDAWTKGRITMTGEVPNVTQQLL